MENVLETFNSLEMNELHLAVQENRSEGVQFLIANGADIANTIDDGQTPLHHACSLNLPNITKELLKNKPRDELRLTINAKTVDTGTAALHLAARNNSLEIARLLLSHGAQFDIRNNDGEPPHNICSDKSIGDLFSSVGKLFDVVSSGNDQVVLDTLNSCARDDLAAVMYARNSQDHTAMQMALGIFNLNAIGKIVDFRMKKLKQDPWQPGVKLDELMRHSKATRLQLNLLEKYRRTSENLIMNSRFKEIFVNLLREAYEFLEAYKEQRDPSLTDQPMLIIIEESLEFFGSWKTSKFIVNDRIGMVLWKGVSFIASLLKICIMTPMQMFMRLVYTSELLKAAERNDFALVKQCLTGHPNLNELDTEGRTALRHAFIHRNYEMAKMLLRLGANPTSDRCWQEDPLLLFALSRMHESRNRVDVEIMQLMFDRVSDDEVYRFVNAKAVKNNNETALDWASDFKSNMDLVRFLLSKGASFRYSPRYDNMERLEQLVRQSFKQARDGQVKELIEKMKKLNVLSLLAVTGTRNEEGQTLEQVVEMSGHVETAKQIRQLLSSKRVEQCKRHAAEFF